MHVEEINDIHELASYRLFWNLLLPQTRHATFFQSLDWLEVFWKHCGGDQRLRALVVCANGRPVGILPLVVRTEPTRLGRLRVLTYPLHDWGTFYGPIGPNPTATLTAGLRHIRQTPRDWDLLDLRWIDREGCDHGRTEGAMRRAGFSPRRQAWAQAPVVDMRRSWEDYWSSRTRKWRQNVRTSRRRLLSRGKVSFLRYRPRGAADGEGDPRWDLYDACVKIAERSWQASSGNGTTLCHASVRDYLRDTHAAAARTGSLDLAMLLLEGEPIAFSCHYHCRGRVYGLRKGFDPRFTTLSPGTVLQQMVLEDGFRRGDSFYDMGVGSLEVKRHWQTSIATSYRCTHFPATVARAQVLRMKRWFQDRIHGRQYVACAKATA
ncbi:MAG: GNAT family N-acetyltransferase [Planctomycetota bacterium]|jgi:CelD/BcsL family acetyltransferase involved in cellulose biosynthesis